MKSFEIPHMSIIIYNDCDLKFWHSLPFIAQVEFLDRYRIPYKFNDIKGREVTLHASTPRCGRVLLPFGKALQVYRYLVCEMQFNDAIKIMEAFKIHYIILEEKSIDPIIGDDGSIIEFTKGPVKKLQIDEFDNFFNNVDKILSIILDGIAEDIINEKKFSLFEI